MVGALSTRWATTVVAQRSTLTMVADALAVVCVDVEHAGWLLDRVYGFIYEMSSNPTKQELEVSYPVGANEFHIFTFVFSVSGNYFRLYVDGILRDSDVATCVALAVCQSFT